MKNTKKFPKFNKNNQFKTYL